MTKIFRTSFVAITISLQTLTAMAADHDVPVRSICSGMNPAIASNNIGQISIAYEDHEKDKTEADIFYLGSSDGGKTWNTPVDVSNTSAGSLHPSICVEKSGALDVAWTDCKPGEESPDVFFARSSDGGKTWSQPKDISNTSAISSEPAIAVGPDEKLHVVWVDAGKGATDTDIYYASSSDGGLKWGKGESLPAENISNTPGSSSAPAIAVNSDANPQVVWLDATSGEDRPDIFYTTLVANKWSTSTNISNSPRRSAHPTVTCGLNSKTYIGWSDNSRKENAADIWCAISNHSGGFDKPLNISGTTGVSSDPVMAADGKRLAVVWTDTTKTDRPQDIWARVSDNFGLAFTNAMDIGNTLGVSKYPKVVLNDHSMFVVWQEVQGLSNKLLFTSINVKGLGTGYIEKVDPALHMHR